MDTLSYAHQYLFGPLGIDEDNIFWEKDPQGIYVGGAWLHMRSRDMAKFGLLYLNKGDWIENHIIPQDWVIQSTTSHVSIEEYADYGYHWWVDDTMYFAEGYKGQFICVLEDAAIVIVLTADIPDSDVSEVFKTIIAYIRSA
jgi:CubicO group peptidase (beta-lactamase class C family)